MKILMIGLGSIGQRHLRNIKRLYPDTDIIAYRVRGLKTTFSDNMQIRENIDLEQEYNIVSYKNLSEALNQKPDAAFVSNVTKFHIPCALEVAKAGCHLFLEKPVSDSMDGVDELVQIVKEKKLKVFVGFQNRYNPSILKVKECLAQGTIGDIVSVHAEVGERLTTMHTYEDYKSTYMARSDLGGGVILNQMIHEIDYLRYLLGDPKCIYAAGSTGAKNMGIDVDDCCDAVLKYNTFAVSLHADFYQYPPSRYILVMGSKGKIKADIIKNEVLLCEGDSVSSITFGGFARNDMFIKELQGFMECIEKGTDPAITLEDGIRSLKIALAAKQSVLNNGIICEL